MWMEDQWLLYLRAFARFLTQVPMHTCSNAAAMKVNDIMGCIRKSACGGKCLYISVWYLGGHI